MEKVKANRTIEEPPTLAEIDRVMAWASCSNCGGALKMLCPQCLQPTAPAQPMTMIEIVRPTSEEMWAAIIAYISAQPESEARETAEFYARAFRSQP
jgi:hypothetical protein